LGRREEILDILTKKFQEEGFSMDLTLSQIAKEVDIGKSTIYEYFKNKDEIYKEAILRIIQSHIDETIASMDQDADFEKSFKYSLRTLLEIAAHSRMMMEVFTRNFIDKLPLGLKEELKQKMESARDSVEEKFSIIFQKGIEEGIIVYKEDKIKQEVITSMVVGSIVRYSNQVESIDLEEFINTIYKYVVYISNH